MDLVVLIFAILYLCGVPVGTPFAICSIIFVVIDCINKIIKKNKWEINNT